MIGFRTAMLAYLGLALFALLTLSGKLLALALIIVAAIAIKTLVHRQRSQMSE